MTAGIPRVPVGGSDDRANRTQMANSVNSALKQLATAQSDISTLKGQVSPIGGDLTGTMPNPTVAANKIDNTKLAQMATKTIKGNNTGGTANAADLTADQTKALLGGMLAQAPVITETGAVATGTTAMPGGDTVPSNTQGDQYLSATITPKNASSSLIIDAQAFVSSSANLSMQMALFQDATSAALASAYADETGTSLQFLRLRHKMTAGTTSATTFKIRVGGVGAGTTTLNGKGGTRIGGGTLTSIISVTEILP